MMLGTKTASLLAIVLLILTGCAGKQQDTIRVGAILHLTGDQAEPAQAFREGIELAADEINRDGGIDGRNIALIIEDDHLQPLNAHSAAVKLVQQDNITAVILASYLEGMAAGPYLQEHRTPGIVLWDSSKDLESIGDHIFGIGIWTPSAGETAARFAYSSGLRRVAIVNVQNEWSQAVCADFKQQFEALGGRIIATHTVLPSDTSDFRTVIAKVQNENPDGIYSPVTDGVTVFYRQLHEAGWQAPIITSDIISESHIRALGPAAERLYQTQAADPASPRTEHMKREYLRKYGREPTHVLFTAWGYDAVFLLKHAAEAHNGTTNIVEGLHSIRGHPGASGIITIDEHGSSRTEEHIFQIRNGTFAAVIS